MAVEPVRTLILLRHAKSAWPDGVPDQERPLTGRGRRDAAWAGEWLARHDYHPDLALCSTAIRAMQTWDLLATRLSSVASDNQWSVLGVHGPPGGSGPSVVLEPRAYAASAHTLLYLLRELPPDPRIVLLIGHNPGISELASALAEPGYRLGMPTASLAVLTITGSWPDLAPGLAALASFVTPAET